MDAMAGRPPSRARRKPFDTRSTKFWVTPVEVYGSGTVAMLWCTKRNLLKNAIA